MRKTYLVILGSLICLVGLAMVPLPGPGMFVIAVGLAVLASAGVLWAARLLVRTRERLPAPADGAESAPPGLIRRAIAVIDRRMAHMAAVRAVREQDRTAKEQAWREDLVTTDRETLPGEAAADEIRTSGSAEGREQRLL